MTLPPQQSVAWTAGETITFTATYSVPTSISGWTLELRIFSNDWSEELLVIDNPTITDSVNGIFSFAVTASQTLGLGAGRFRYAIWRTDAGDTKKLAAGQLISV